MRQAECIFQDVANIQSAAFASKSPLISWLNSLKLTKKDIIGAYNKGAVTQRLMRERAKICKKNVPRRMSFFVFFLAILSLSGFLIPNASAQNTFKWPWEIFGPQERPQEQFPLPAIQQPAEQQYPQEPQAPLSNPKSSICFQLEQRLVQESQFGNKSRDLIPMIDSQLRQIEQQYRVASSTLENANCYDYFLFAKTLKKTKKCMDLSREVEGLNLRRGDLQNQRNQLMASSGQSYQDEIIRELARNNCGSIYTEQASRQQRKDPFSGLWEEDSGSNDGRLGKSFSNLPFATYRTLCVRLCDGYYFPVSFSTLPNHFERDEYTCQSKCMAPTELYYYQNPGGAVEQMVGARTNIPYSQLQNAFRYRREYVEGCSCKEQEFNTQEAGSPNGQTTSLSTPSNSSVGQTEGAANSGWSSQTITEP
ncbi:MAG: DUF2865 domain-containing protein [Hyphomicrobium sp.]